MVLPLRTPDTGREVGVTMDRLRHEIDSGRTGDKVAARDLAAAPLGTDEEAAGTPTRPATLSPEPVSTEPSQVHRQYQRAGFIVGALVLAGLAALVFA